MATDDERERIREQKRRELLNQTEGGDEDADATPSGTPDEPVHVEGADHLQSLVEEHDVVLADFYADWCGPCKMLEPTVEALAGETDAAVAKVDIDRHQALAQQQGVQGVPTLFLYADGEPVDRMVGVQEKAVLADRIAEYA